MSRLSSLFALAPVLAIALAACAGGVDDGDTTTLIGPNDEQVSVVDPCAVVTEAEVISIFGATGPAVGSGGGNCHWGGNGADATLVVFVRAVDFGATVQERRDYFADNASVAVSDLPDLGDDAIELVGTRRYEPGGPEVVEVDGIVFQVGPQRVDLQTGTAYHFEPGSAEADALIAVARAAVTRLANDDG